MKAKISSYEDLEVEKLRLQTALVYQGSLIRQDVADLKEELKPIKSVLGFAGKFISKDKKNPIINAGVDIIGDLLLKNVLFARSSFITKWIAPYLIKNFSANLLSQNEEGIVNQIGGKIRELVAKWRRASR